MRFKGRSRISVNRGAFVTGAASVASLKFNDTEKQSVGTKKPCPPYVVGLFAITYNSRDATLGEKLMIPRIVHQTWKNRDVPKEYILFQEKVSALHPGWEYRLWTDRTIWRL